jgi:hypothetical protein
MRIAGGKGVGKFIATGTLILISRKIKNSPKPGE